MTNDDLAPLLPLMSKVARVHGGHDPRLLEVQEVLLAAGDTLEVSSALRRIRDLTAGFSLPPWACTSYRALFERLREAEAAA